MQLLFREKVDLSMLETGWKKSQGRQNGLSSSCRMENRGVWDSHDPAVGSCAKILKVCGVLESNNASTFYSKEEFSTEKKSSTIFLVENVLSYTKKFRGTKFMIFECQFSVFVAVK